MKKGQSGVSLIALVITIIVVIILAAVAFGTSVTTITNANWSTFTNALGEVRTALQERVTTVRGQEAQQGVQRTEAQVYNYVAKGAKSNTAWLSKDQADYITATQITEDVIKNDLGLRNLNEILVNTSRASRVKVSYFVTRSGEVFIWPPYEYEGEYYINDKTKLSDVGYKAIDAAADAAADANGSKTYEVKMIRFNKDLQVIVAGKSAPEEADKLTTKATAAGDNAASLAALPTVYYLDAAKTDSPVGLEYKADFIYNNGSEG